MGWALRLIAVAVGIFVAAKLSQHLTSPPSNASPVWPGAGIALAVTLLYGRRALIGVFIGVVAFEFQLFAATGAMHALDNGLVLAPGLALGAVLQAWFGAELIRRFVGPQPRLVGDVEILRFQLLGGPLACTVSATVGMLVLWRLEIVGTANLPVSWLTWWVGDTIGVVVFAPLVLIFFKHKDPLWHHRKVTVALPMLLLLLTAVAFYTYAHRKENEETRLRFGEQTHAIHNALRREFQIHLEVVDFLKGLFDTGIEISSDEFRIFARSALHRNAGIQALEWIPRIGQAQREAFERQLPGGGPIRRLAAEGGLRQAEARPEYYAIQYIEPPADNATAFGFDVTSNPRAEEALFRARDTGTAAATGALKLVQETENEIGVVIYNPVYRGESPPADLERRRQRIIGVVAAVFRMQSLMRTAMPSIGRGEIAIRLSDITENKTPRVLYESHGADAVGWTKQLSESHPFDMAGRRWLLEFSATPEYLAAHTTWAVWVVLTGGLMITALLGTGLLTLTGRTLRTEEKVIERTAELRAEVEQRRSAETQLRLVLDGAKLGFWDRDFQSGHYWVNDRWLEMLGLERSDLENDGCDWTARMHPDDKVRTLAVIEKSLRHDAGETVEFRMRHKDGHWVWIQSAGAVVSRDPDSGDPLRLCGIHQDITERMLQEEHILRQAHYDSLTELPNRFLALDRLSQLLNEARRNRERVAVLFLDLDDFKKINDTLGHDTGDKLLKQAAARLQSAVRGGDTVGRLGGDEFIVLLGGLDNAADARPVAENLLGQFSEAFRIDNRELVLTASIGISVYPEDGDNPSELLRNSDSAMYHSKEQGRNTYSYFTDEMNRGVSRRLQIEEQLHGALGRDEFHVCYQPKVEIGSGRIVGAEALLRWNNPALGEVSPMEFIPIAEQSGLIVPIGRFVLSEALGHAAQWGKGTADDFTMAVNLSPRQFRDPNLLSFVEESIAAAGIEAASLELEITEGVLMSGHAAIDDTLAALNDFGVRIAMDDFGTGYSSLSYLRSYPFDVLKIDREFVSDLTHDATDRELVNAAIAMAHGLGLKVVAEGVETAEQNAFLAAQSCDYGQGWLFGKPVPAGEMAELLETARQGDNALGHE